MNSKHTPGPWRTVPHNQERLYNVYGSGDWDRINVCIGVEGEGNACLIAKAPELLECLRHLLHEADFEDLETAAKRKARALIAEIEGAQFATPSTTQEMKMAVQNQKQERSNELKKIDGTFERELREMIDEWRSRSAFGYETDVPPYDVILKHMANELETILNNYKEEA